MSGIVVYDCGKCNRSFLTPEALKGHLSWHKKQEQKEKQEEEKGEGD